MSKFDKVDLAEAQFLGFNHGVWFSDDIVGLVDSMGLQENELDSVIDRYPDTLSESQVLEIRGYFSDSGTK